MLFFDFVKLALHMPGEGDVHYFREVLVEFVGNDLTHIGGEELFVLLLDVAAVLDSTDDRGVGARPADAFLFERLYERAFGIPGGRLGEMLLSLDIHDGQALPHFRLRQLLPIRISRPDFCEAIEEKHPAGSFIVTGADGGLGHDFQSRYIRFRWLHLAGYEAAPDDVVELELLICKKRPNISRRKVDVGRADGFMCLLGGFLRGVNIGFFGQVLGADMPVDKPS